MSDLQAGAMAHAPALFYPFKRAMLDHFGMSNSAAERWRAEGKVKTVKIGRKRMISATEIRCIAAMLNCGAIA